MSRHSMKELRVLIDADLHEAVQSIAKARKMTPAAYVTESVRLNLEVLPLLLSLSGPLRNADDMRRSVAVVRDLVADLLAGNGVGEALAEGENGSAAEAEAEAYYAGRFGGGREA